MDNTIPEILHEIKQARAVRETLSHRISAVMAEIRRIDELEQIYTTKIGNIVDRLTQEALKEDKNGDKTLV